MIVLIYGAGAVGLGLGSCLLKAEAEVDLAGKEDTVASLSKYGLHRTGIFGDFQAEPSGFRCSSVLGSLSEKKYDYILVCTKSFDSYGAAKDLSQHKNILDKEGKTVLCQNGWGNAEIFADFFEKERVYSARIITGFRRPNKHTVDITVHADAIRVGSLFGADSSYMEDLCESITRGGIPCEVTTEIGEYLWAKMLYNCALNPVGALLDVPYGVLAEYKNTRFIMDHIIREVFNVTTGAGYGTHYQTAEDFLDVFYSKLVPDTAEHWSSTLQDIKAGKRTEIDALNGAVIELSKKLGMEVPYNCAVYNLVKFLDIGNT
jgi:2-dehydropantoate 2-reductase